MVNGGLANDGAITVNGSAGHAARLVFRGAGALTGYGVVNLGAFGVIGAAAGASLTNSNIIQGAGSLAGGGLTNTASGTIDATGNLVLSGGAAISDGVVESTGAGVLTLSVTTLNDNGGGSVVDGHQMRLLHGSGHRAAAR